MTGLPVEERRPRLPAAERRAAIVEAALQVFGERSYVRATTAEIARAAGVSEPILYRHFTSKRDLYIACLDAMSARLQETAESIIAAEPDPREWTFAIPRALDRLRKSAIYPSQMWIQALGEAGEDAELTKYLRRHVRELHVVCGGHHPPRAGGGRRRRRPRPRGRGVDRDRHRAPSLRAGTPRRRAHGRRRRDHPAQPPAVAAPARVSYGRR